MKRPEYSRDSSLNPCPAASRSSSWYSVSCDWGSKTERRRYSLGESVFEHPDGAPASPKSKSVLLSLSGYAGVEGVWGRRGGSGCDPHGVDGDTPRTARSDGIVAASLFQCPDYAIGAPLPRTRMKAPSRRGSINCEPVSFARGDLRAVVRTPFPCTDERFDLKRRRASATLEMDTNRYFGAETSAFLRSLQ